jgi:uncharacterized protein
MTLPPGPRSDDISAVRLRLLTAEEWNRILSGDPGEAARWVHAAAHHGFRAAQVTWGQMLLDGRGTARDPAAALRWFRRAAETGSIDGINMVGRCHELGWGVEPDHGEAMRWYGKAAAKASDWGQYNLASMFLYGEGIERDRARALHWYGLAAGQGHAKAMGMLGRFHEEGWEVPADPAQAMRWYRRAAEGGDAWGQYHLARLLAGDRPDEARAWLGRAVEGGTPNILRAIAPTLLDHPDPPFREMGLRALERCCETGDPQAFLAYGRALAARQRPAEAASGIHRASGEADDKSRRGPSGRSGLHERLLRGWHPAISTLWRRIPRRRRGEA